MLQGGIGVSCQIYANRCVIVAASLHTNSKSLYLFNGCPALSLS